MKRILPIITMLLMLVCLSGFKLTKDGDFNDTDLYDTQKIYETEEIDACALGNTKTYMDYRSITNTSSIQYRYIRENMTVDNETGFLLDDEGFIGVALGSYFGDIGTRFYITLDTGVVLPVVKIEEKADRDTDYKGCAQRYDGSVIEFVIDEDKANNYYGYYRNGFVLQGNYSNYYIYDGSIEKIEKCSDEKRQDYVSYDLKELTSIDYSIYNYASGY